MYITLLEFYVLVCKDMKNNSYNILVLFVKLRNIKQNIYIIFYFILST